MNYQDIKPSILGNKKGAVAVFVAVTVVMLIMFTALAIDVGHLYGVKNELHNAADAGALAGAHELFDNSGNLTTDTAKTEALRVTQLNRTGDELVVAKTVETGHWSFQTKTFTVNENTTQADWMERSFTDLDTDINFINAVRVVSERGDTPSFFARIFGFNFFTVNAEAVAYIGFAGSIEPHDVDQPFAICQQFLKTDDRYSCGVARSMSEQDETGGWTNLENADDSGACTSTNTPVVKNLVCSGNSTSLTFGQVIGTDNGALESVLDLLIDSCWNVDGEPPTEPLNATLPVVDCQSGGFSQPCVETLVGVVNVDIIWIQRKDHDPAPREMRIPNTDTIWTCPDTSTDEECWEDFVGAFDLPEGIALQKNSIYFHTNCEVHKPVGETGGDNFGILAAIPKLVQ